jgi:trimeric autotransporter adhesin
LTLTAGTAYELKFTYSDWGFEEKLRVAIGDSPASASMTTELFDVTTTEDEEAHDETVPFTVDADGVYYIGFQAHSDGNMFNLYVGKISVDAVLSTPGFDLSKLSYYPNPVQDVLTLNYADTIDSVEVVNILGQKVYQKDFASTEAKVDMNKLPAGTYIVNVVSKGLTKNIKVIKK